MYWRSYLTESRTSFCVRCHCLQTLLVASIVPRATCSPQGVRKMIAAYWLAIRSVVHLFWVPLANTLMLRETEMTALQQTCEESFGPRPLNAIYLSTHCKLCMPACLLIDQLAAGRVRCQGRGSVPDEPPPVSISCSVFCFII